MAQAGRKGRKGGNGLWGDGAFATRLYSGGEGREKRTREGIKGSESYRERDDLDIIDSATVG
jgi:hypothetical protein